MGVKAVLRELKSKVLLIDQNGNKNYGVDPEEAFRRAEDAGLDLVKVGDNEDYSICKIMDFKKTAYKKQRAVKVKKVKLKEVRFGPDIAKNDTKTKVKQIDKFLKSGNKVKMTFILRKRQNPIHTPEQRLEEVLDMVTLPFVKESSFSKKGLRCYLTISPSSN